MTSIIEKPQQSIPSENHYTCLACHVVFSTSELQRDHYHTDWHKYNLKRKIAELTPVSAEEFAEKLLAAQMKGQEEKNRSNLVYECATCRKSYSSENAFHNHLLSRRHKDIQESQSAKEGERAVRSNTTPARSITGTEPLVGCLFCSQLSADFDANLNHMRLAHGFFLPDKEYLKDPEGLIKYLTQKIADAICLYCNKRGKDWKSAEAVRAHMIAVGHCKMAYDESEDPDELLRYYDFGAVNDTSTRSHDNNNNNGDPEYHSDELVLENGTRICSRRSFRHHYKQHHHMVKKETQDEKEDATTAIASLPRRERRHPHQLTITDVAAQQKQQEQHAQTFQGVQAAAAQLYEDQRYATKHNVNTLKRFRTQNPI
ncbi:C2H2 type zinc-finger-domain-containing protein [Dichotomocladium elegans]|nr:C2H2 type zinc-finger-domain-containing protein [Dichotomocladium elegans]